MNYNLRGSHGWPNMDHGSVVVVAGLDAAADDAEENDPADHAARNLAG